MNNSKLNGNWIKIIVCAAVGVVMGIIVFFIGNAAENDILLKILGTLIILPLGVNLVYWGWIATFSALKKSNMFMVMTIGKWVIFFIIVFFASYIVGFVAFPKAVIRAVRNEP